MKPLTPMQEIKNGMIRDFTDVEYIIRPKSEVKRRLDEFEEAIRKEAVEECIEALPKFDALNHEVKEFALMHSTTEKAIKALKSLIE